MAKYARILSIDGGGIRGIVPGEVLAALERILREESGRPDARVADHFDLVAGTSTGGILACLLLAPGEGGRPRYAAVEAVDLYFSRGAEIFELSLFERLSNPGGLLDERYPAAGLERALRDYLGETRLSQLLRPCLLTSYDIEGRRAHFFARHDAAADPAYDFPAREAARATAAAPTYFETAIATSGTGVRYALVDGGVFANNPAMCAYAESRSRHADLFPGREESPTARDMVMLTLGTGTVEKPFPYREAKDWGVVGWVKPLFDIMMSGVADTVDYELRLLFRGAGVDRQYLRVQPRIDPLLVNPEMDDASPRNLAALRDLGRRTAEAQADGLRRVARLLLE